MPSANYIIVTTHILMMPQKNLPWRILIKWKFWLKTNWDFWNRQTIIKYHCKPVVKCDVWFPQGTWVNSEYFNTTILLRVPFQSGILPWLKYLKIYIFIKPILRIWYIFWQPYADGLSSPNIGFYVKQKYTLRSPFKLIDYLRIWAKRSFQLRSCLPAEKIIFKHKIDNCKEHILIFGGSKRCYNSRTWVHFFTSY